MLNFFIHNHINTVILKLGIKRTLSQWRLRVNEEKNERHYSYRQELSICVEQ